MKTISYQIFTSKQEGIPCIYNLDNHITIEIKNVIDSLRNPRIVQKKGQSMWLHDLIIQN